MASWLAALLVLVVLPQLVYAAIRLYSLSTRAPGIADLLPPWWLLLACAAPAIVLARHAWGADAVAIARRPWRSLGHLLAAPAAMIAVGMAGAALGAHQEGMMAELGAELAAPSPWALVLAIGLLAPVLEELVFRGLAWRWLRPGLGAGGTIVASSAVFAALHAGQYGAFGVAMVAAMALVLGLVRERTGSLLLCIGGHMLVNLMAVAALLAR
jgi:membrane protease YdiL (CAAX protease family)